MKVLSNALLILSGVYLSLGLIYLRFWWAERARREYLAFTLCSFAVTLFSWGELSMMHSSAPEEYLFYAWWNFLVGVCPTLAIAWFAYIHLGGRRWLFWTYCAFRLLGVLVHLVTPNGINFREIKSVGQMTVLGEALSYPIAVANPWMILPHLSHILLVIFCLDASIRVWRRGERRKALIFGTGVVLYRVLVSIGSIGILWGLVQLPFFVSFPIIFVIAAMLYELNYEMHSAAMLTEQMAERDAQLTETLEQLNLSAAAASVGMWTRKIGEEEITVSEKAGEIWGFSSEAPFTRKDFFQNIYPEDRQFVLNNIEELENGKNEFHIEYRVLHKDRSVRWVYSSGKVESVNGARIIRGAVVDITQRKLAEDAVYELSRKLMNAQEKERARLARELHDDLSQNLALVSVQLSQLGDDPTISEDVKNQVNYIVNQTIQLSGDVRRISHELHPAILTQLGLELALHSYSRELASAHSMKIDFKAENLPSRLPEEVSLCLYRVTQESLQNVIKHSGASAVQVDIISQEGEILLTVSDNGVGFDLKAEQAKTKESLGLISIEERVRAVKGKVKIVSAVDSGTKVKVRIPVDPQF